MSKKSKPQIDRILSHLKRGYKLTPLRALQSFGTMRLAAYIHALRKMGHTIITNTIAVGPDQKRVAQYHMPRR